jgi:hypothetical protein
LILSTLSSELRSSQRALFFLFFTDLTLLAVQQFSNREARKEHYFFLFFADLALLAVQQFSNHKARKEHKDSFFLYGLRTFCGSTVFEPQSSQRALRFFLFFADLALWAVQRFSNHKARKER